MGSLDKVCSDLLGSVTGENTVNDAINSIVDYLGAAGGIVFELERRQRRILTWHSRH